MIEQDYIDNIYQRLTSMDMQLDPNPIEYGPGRLQEKVSVVRGYLSQTEMIFMEVSHILQSTRRSLLVKQTEFDIAQTGLIANDPHVQSGRSQREREARAATKLVENQNQINDLTFATHDLEEIIKIIKAKRTDLKDIQGRIRDQLKLIQEEIALGKRWGSKKYVPKKYTTQEDSEAQQEDSEAQQEDPEEEFEGILKSTSEKDFSQLEESLPSLEEISLDEEVEESVGDDFDMDQWFD